MSGQAFLHLIIASRYRSSTVCGVSDHLQEQYLRLAATSISSQHCKMSTGPNHNGNAGGTAAEQHDTVAELAARWGWSSKTVIRVFERETGVLILDRHETRHKRGYRTLTIPKSVSDRVHRRMELK